MPLNENEDFEEEINDLPPGEGEGNGEAEPTPPPYLRDLTEDDVYERLSRVNEFQPQMTAMESRLNGGVNALTERMSAFEKGLPTQAAFDVEKLTKGLEAYDPKLAEVLGPLLQEAFKINALDENTLRPHLDPLLNQMRELIGRELVSSHYSSDAISEIIPEVQDGRFVPQGQRQKDFADWYGQQGYETQQALLSFGAPYIHALRKFEKWEKEKTASRAAAAANREKQLERGQVPSSQNRNLPGTKALSDSEAFTSGFDEVLKEVS